MAPLSPQKRFLGKKTFGVVNACLAFSCKRSFALTPPAKTIALVSGYCFRAFCNFSSKISQAVSWNEAEKSATCCADKRFFSSWEG